MFCGLLCGGATEPETLWLEHVLDGLDSADLLVQECRQGLDDLGAETREAIDGPGMGFTPLLPGDGRPLSERARALALWCQGFLYGVGVTGTRDEHLSPEGAEALRDLASISQLDSGKAEGSEEDEEAYTELTEFVWVAAMLIHEERAPLREAEP
jgi:uncharacterized protein YgfB (UPF0149 family)